MSGKTFQVFTRQILAVPMEGGWFIAEKVTAGTIHSDEGRGRRSGYSAVEAPRSGKSQDDESSKACSYCCCGCLALLWAAINIYMIVIGAIEDCTIEDSHVRIYLLVQGSFNLFQLIVCILSTCATAADKEGILARCLNCFNGILMLFIIAWTVTGSVWVWRSLDDWKDDHSLCNNAVFISAIVCLSLHYVVILLMCCCCACAICVACNSDSLHAIN